MNVEHQNLKNIRYVGTKGLVKHRAVLVQNFVDHVGRDLAAELSEQGIELLHVLNDSKGLLTQIEFHQPDLLIMSVDFLDAITLDQLIKVNEQSPLPVVVFAKKHAPEVMKMVVEVGVSSYVVDDVKAHRFLVIIDLAMARFAKMQNLSTELKQTKEKLSERKLIEKAKGIIMRQKHLSEEDAYSQMRRSAMNQGQTMAELAKRVITVFDMFE